MNWNDWAHATLIGLAVFPPIMVLCVFVAIALLRGGRGYPDNFTELETQPNA